MRKLRMHKSMIIYLLAASVICTMPSRLLAGPGVTAEVSTGQGRIVSEDVPQAKKNAISTALDLAVQNAVTALLPRDVLARNLGAVYEKILSHTSDYIETYKVLSELEQSGYYLVAVESKVNLDRLEKRLMDHQIIMTGQDSPVVLMLISEKTGMEILPRYWWGNNPLPYESVVETVLNRAMTREKIMNSAGSTYRPDPSFYEIVFESIYDENAAMDLGKQIEADLVIIGSARAVETLNRMEEEQAYMAKIDLGIFHIETREKIAAVTVEETVSSDTAQTGYHDALAKSAQAAAMELISQIHEFWTEYNKNEKTIAVNISGEHFLSRYVALKEIFRKMPEIESILPKELGTNDARVDLVYRGDAFQFAKALVLKSFPSFGIEISQVTRDALSISFVALDEEQQDEEQPDEAQPDEAQQKDDQAP